MTIKILGSCSDCDILYQNVLAAVKECGISAEILRMTDCSEIADYEELVPPVFMVDEKILSMGKVLTDKEIIKLLCR